MSKSYCLWGYCDHMLIPALVDGVFKFIFEILKFALLLVATFWLAIGIFQWWDYAASPVCTNFGLQPSTVSLKDPQSKKTPKAYGVSLKKSDFQAFSAKTADSNISDEGFYICQCGRRVPKGGLSQNKNCTTEQCLKSPPAATYTNYLSEIKSAELRTQPTRATSSSGPCDGPNIAKIYAELLKQNAMRMYLNDLNPTGLSEDLLEKIKRANVTNAPSVTNATYPASNSKLATTAPLASNTELLLSPKQSSAVNCDLSYSAVAYNHDDSSSNEENAQVQKLNRNVNLSNETTPSSLHAALPQSVSKIKPTETNINAVPKEREAEARVCRCRNPKCKRRVQLY